MSGFGSAYCIAERKDTWKEVEYINKAPKHVQK